ncbi:hypothetical protein EST38_g8504 [Candolleomyces aberdarensis]|uniref:Uncharacterized protein n=1 Tax=Candolleomyces aberdarensis TaxID=2316362 RepID=A0A4Q2DFT0_9AGAR|nr:hypothetical protein EST38_g8504 [Candolleomyces aberdarensis]
MPSSKGSKPTLEKPIVDADDDLDELDDVLDDFNEAPKAPPPTATLAPVSSGRPRTNTRVGAQPASVPGHGPPLDSTEEELDENVLSSAFAKELAKGMENLMREIAEESTTQGSSSRAKDGGDGNAAPEEEKAKLFRAAWEAMLIEEMNGKEGQDPLVSLGDVLGQQSKGGAPSSSSGPSSSAAAGENFQDKIKQTMGKFKEMEDKAKAAESSGSAGADSLNPEEMEAMLKSLKDLGLGDLGGLDGSGEGESEAELAGFLESMMGQLMNKDILYDPLKELADGFPPYLAKPPKPISDEDRERYGKQLICVNKIVAIFEQPSYSDSDPEAGKQVVELMSEMQTYGSPPPEIMGPLPPGFDGNFPGLGDENCIIA